MSDQTKSKFVCILTQYFYPDHTIVDNYFNDALRDNLFGSS